jgi:hypothetical protein
LTRFGGFFISRTDVTDDQQPASLPLSEIEFRAHVAAALAAGERRMDSLTEDIKANTDEVKANTRLTEEIRADTKEFLEVFKAVKGGLKVMGWVGTFLKWLSGVAVACGAIYMAAQGAVKHLLK